jgi:hydroxymethylglutaryl-CoA reductase
MKTTADQEHFIYTTVFELIIPFDETIKPLWGSMNATQMLEHMSLAIQASNGILTAPLTFEKSEKLKRISLLSDRPLPLDFNNPVLAMVPKSEEVFTHEEAKVRLRQNVDLFKNAFEANGPSHTYMHNMFGPLNYQEWVLFHYKHFHHHMAQFALIPYVEKFDL